MAEKNKGRAHCISIKLAGSRLCFLYCLLAFVAGQVRAQHIEFTYETYGLEIDRDNVIQNASHLKSFFEGLYQLDKGRDRQMNIVHIGDSHIQADYMTSVIRRNFHRHFGNAGRGLIVPLHVAGTNEPNNFKTVSNVAWNSKRIVFPDRPLPIGVGGVTIQSNDPSACLEIYMNDLWLDYSFNRLTLFFEKDEKSFDFSVTDGDGRILGRIESLQPDSSENAFRISWKDRVNSIKIQSEITRSAQQQAIIYGLVLENSAPGILYHAIGVNGARFRHFLEAKYFAAQTKALHADLFIISLGTNESLDYPYLDKNFFAEVDGLVSVLRRNNPVAKFILVTPQDAFRQRNKSNPGIMQVRELIIRYAVENGFAFYDMFRAMGGQYSASSWSGHALLGRDGIHLTKDGYEYQGNLFYHALMKGYNQYVPTRHP